MTISGRLIVFLTAGLALLCADLLAQESVQTKHLASWCTVSYPDQIVEGQVIEMVVQVSGVAGPTKLCADLHWNKKDGSYQGIIAWGGPYPDVQGDASHTFRFRIQPKPDLGFVGAVIFLSEDGSWEKRSKEIRTDTLPVTDDPGVGPRPEGIKFNKSWIYIDASASGRVMTEGDDWDIPVEYYLDPSEDWGGTTLVLNGHGPWIDCPDGKYTTRRYHEPCRPGVFGQVAVKPGRGRHVFHEEIPNAHRHNSLLLLAMFRGADDKDWPWHVRRSGPWYRRKGGYFELETDRPGSLFTYEEPVRIDVVLREGDDGARRSAQYKVYDTTGATVAEGAVPLPAGQAGRRVPIEPAIERRGTFLIEVEVDGWEKRETTFCRIPDVLAITKGQETAFGATNVVTPEAPERVAERCQVARRLGLTACRSFMPWYQVQPGPKTWKLDEWDQALRIGKEQGIGTWLLPAYPPSWAQRAGAGYVGYRAFEVDEEAWRESVRVMTERWKDLIIGCEWLNEIVPGGAGGDPTGAYVRFCRIGSETARSIAPDLKMLLAGGLWPRSFRTSVLKAGVGEHIDVLPIHYANGSGVLEARDDLDTAGLEHVAVWDDESGRGISVWGMPPLEALRITSQSNWVLERWADELAAGCEKIIYFGGSGSAAGNWDYMMDDFSPRPLAATLAVFVSKLFGAEPAGVFALGKRGMFHLFDRGGEAVLVASSYEEGGETVPLHVGVDGLVVTDYQGNETQVAARGGLAELELKPLRCFVEGADLDVVKAYVVPSVEQTPGASVAAFGAGGRSQAELVQTPRVTVLRAESGTLTVRLRNPHERDLSGSVSISAPAGWPAPRPVDFSLRAGEDRTVRVAVAFPPDAGAGDHAVRAVVRFAWEKLPQVEKPFVLTLISPEMVGNLLKNGDFEQVRPDGGPSSWGSGAHGRVAPAEGPDLGHGQRVFRFDDTGDQWTYVSQSTSVPAGRMYLYTAWVWNRNMSAGSNIYQTLADGTEVPLYDVRVFTAGDNTPYWQVFTARYSAPADLTKISFSPVAKGGAGSWALYDNLRVTVFEGTDFAAECRAVQRAPLIDGDLGDWTGECPVPLIGANQLTALDDGYAWTPANLSGVAFLRWDSASLYVAVRVRDDVHRAVATGDRAVEDDSLILAFHPTNRLPGDDGKAFAFYVSSARPGGGSGEHTLFRPEAYSGGLGSGHLARDSSVYELTVRREEGLTVYEMRFPWAELGGLRPVFGGKFGMSIQLNDNDGAGRVAHVNWGEGISPAWRPARFGVVTLDR